MTRKTFSYALPAALATVIFSACAPDIHPTRTDHMEPDTAYAVSSAATSGDAEKSEMEQTFEISDVASKTEAEKTEPELELPENMKLLDVSKYNGGYSGFGVLKGSIYCEIAQSNMRFYDINKQTLEAKIPLPKANTAFIRSDESCLCKIRSLDKNGNDKIITVYRDYTYDDSDYTLETASFSVCGHNIAEYGYDIIDADTNEKILEGGVWNDQENFGYKFLFEIDENRFVYQKAGDVHSLGFGIYDFETGSDTCFAGTEEHIPFGFHGGKIYSDIVGYCPDDPIGDLSDDVHNNIYITDIETGEKKHGFNSPLTEGYNEIRCTYAMPENGEFIALLAFPYELEDPYLICVMDPDTGEIMQEYKMLNRDIIHCRSIWFSDSSTVLITNGSGGNKLIVADLNL